MLAKAYARIAKGVRRRLPLKPLTERPVDDLAPPSDDAGLLEAERIVDAYILDESAERDRARTNYLNGQRVRYIHTLAQIPTGRADQRALEIATTEILNVWMKTIKGYGRVDCTVWNQEIRDKCYEWDGATYYNLDLEAEPLAAPDATYDFVLCTEVLEHLALDPMFMLSELNRVTKPGGLIFLTTPNITSARGIWRMLRGEAPYLFPHYLVPLVKSRHNLEYSPQMLAELMAAAGYEVERFWTADTFDEPIPQVMELLKMHNCSTDMRGDNIFFIGRKVGPVNERHPPSLYFNWL